MYCSREMAAAEDLIKVKKSYQLIKPYADEFNKSENNGLMVVRLKLIAVVNR